MYKSDPEFFLTLFNTEFDQPKQISLKTKQKQTIFICMVSFNNA
jgi:hypothetical protein